MLDASVCKELESEGAVEVTVDCLPNDVMGKAKLLTMIPVELALSLVVEEKGNSDLGRVTVVEIEEKPEVPLLAAVGEML